MRELFQYITYKLKLREISPFTSHITDVTGTYFVLSQYVISCRKMYFTVNNSCENM